MNDIARAEIFNADAVTVCDLNGVIAFRNVNRDAVAFDLNKVIASAAVNVRAGCVVTIDNRVIARAAGNAGVFAFVGNVVRSVAAFNRDVSCRVRNVVRSVAAVNRRVVCRVGNRIVAVGAVERLAAGGAVQREMVAARVAENCNGVLREVVGGKSDGAAVEFAAETLNTVEFDSGGAVEFFAVTNNAVFNVNAALRNVLPVARFSSVHSPACALRLGNLRNAVNGNLLVADVSYQTVAAALKARKGIAAEINFISDAEAADVDLRNAGCVDFDSVIAFGNVDARIFAKDFDKIVARAAVNESVLAGRKNRIVASAAVDIRVGSVAVDCVVARAQQNLRVVGVIVDSIVAAAAVHNNIFRAVLNVNNVAAVAAVENFAGIIARRQMILHSLASNRPQNADAVIAEIFGVERQISVAIL